MEDTVYLLRIQKNIVFTGLQQHFQMTKNTRRQSFPKAELFLSLVKLIVFIEGLTFSFYLKKHLNLKIYGGLLV